MDYWPYLQFALSFFLALLISLVVVPTIINVVKQKNFYDMPNERAAHTNKTPTLGGIAIFISLMMVFPVMTTEAPWNEIRFLFTALAIIFGIGIKDDILAISPMKKMLGQIAAAFILVYFADLRISNLHGFNGIFELNYVVSIVLSVFAYIVIINAYNFIDGIDGLAAGTGALHSLIFGIWFVWRGEMWSAMLAATLAGALMGFFPYNVYGKNHKIFMGDTGSLIIGLLLTIFVFRFNELNIDSTQPATISSSPSVSFAIMGLPLFDFLRIIFVRKVLNKSITSPDKLHLHHRMLRLGLSHSASTYWLLGASMFFAAFGFYFQHISIRRLLLLEILLAMFLSYIPTYLYDKRQRNKKNTQES